MFSFLVDTVVCQLDTTVAGQDVLFVQYWFNVRGDDSALNGLFRIEVELGAGIEASLTAFVIRGALVAKYGPPHRKRSPDDDGLDEPADLRVPAESWVSGESEILFANYEDQIFDLQFIHWPLWREHRRRQTAELLDDL